MAYKHAYLNTVLLLHSTFMLSVVKMSLKGEARGHALIHGKIMELCFEFLWEPCHVNHLGLKQCYIGTTM